MLEGLFWYVVHIKESASKLLNEGQVKRQFEIFVKERKWFSRIDEIILLILTHLATLILVNSQWIASHDRQRE